MNAREFKFVGVIIIVIILVTLGAQSYSIYQDYQKSKRRYKTSMQEALDNSVEKYYSELAKEDPFNFTGLDTVQVRESSRDSLGGIFKKFFKTGTNPTENSKPNIDSLSISISEKEDTTVNTQLRINNLSHIMVLNYKEKDSLSFNNDNKRLVIYIARDTLDFPVLVGHLSEELRRKDLQVDYALTHLIKDSVSGRYSTDSTVDLSLCTEASSTFLPKKTTLEMHFENSPLSILRFGIGEMLFSLLFLLVVSGVLIYLYRIIRSQKELSEIKNSLISNITHEFKTPIATVSSALEGIQDFNRANDPVKTDKYLSISRVQMGKLNQMVEKLLETATLDKGSFALEKEKICIQSLTKPVVEKFRTLAPGKEIDLAEGDYWELEADPFHLENAISNLIDNAVKYGGDEIIVRIDRVQRFIVVEDSGANIPSDQREKIFDQFYRIPQGNVHDVKGFGIGLYYTRKIAEAHGGRLTLETVRNRTVFKFALT